MRPFTYSEIGKSSGFYTSIRQTKTDFSNVYTCSSLNLQFLGLKISFNFNL